jgi:precorrin-3B synthase
VVLSFASPHAGHLGADRCPGTLTVHQARDGGLVRIRIPGGTLPASLLAALGDWSHELGNGRMELTARGNLQLRGLVPGAEVELADRLTENGLLPSPAHDRARNVLASPLSGRDGRSAWDVRPLVGELDRGLCASAELAELPGRFLFALDDGRGDAAGLGADVAIVALPGDRAALLLGGVDSGLRPSASAAVAMVLDLARAFLRERADERVWRVSELPEGSLSLVRPPGTVEPRVAVPGRESSGAVGRFDQTDGRIALGVGIPLGELSPARSRLLAVCAAGEVVLTPWRGVLLPDLDPDLARAAAVRLTGAGLLLDPAEPLVGVSACTGRPGCASALADVRADALAAVSSSASAGVPVHWSGCARRCGRPAGPVVDVVAAEDGYRVLRDGEPVRSGTAAAAVQEAVEEALRARSGEPVSAEPAEGRVPDPAHLRPGCAGSRTSPAEGPGVGQAACTDHTGSVIR